MMSKVLVGVASLGLGAVCLTLPAAQATPGPQCVSRKEWGMFYRDPNALNNPPLTVDELEARWGIQDVRHNTTREPQNTQASGGVAERWVFEYPVCGYPRGHGVTTVLTEHMNRVETGRAGDAKIIAVAHQIDHSVSPNGPTRQEVSR